MMAAMWNIGLTLAEVGRAGLTVRGINLDLERVAYRRPGSP
jgi:hypothetical protein